jgi:hypothetical protein
MAPKNHPQQKRSDQTCDAEHAAPMRDRAILATLLYHDMRREELCGLRIRDM